MNVKPILFSGPMVQALLAGRKTQTRRVIKPQPELLENGKYHVFNAHGGCVGLTDEEVPTVALDYVPYSIGDLLYVRETWRCNGWATDLATLFYKASQGDGYTAMCEQYPVDGKKRLRVEAKWAPSIHMPRWASRLTLKVTDVRVQRLQDITEADAGAEGVTRPILPHWKGELYRSAFRGLWNSLNSDRGFGWEMDPWICAVTFSVHKQNVDELLKARAA